MREQIQEKTDISLQSMTREELLAKAKEDNHPWLPAIGIFQDGAVFEEWQQAVQDYRCAVDDDTKGLSGIS